MGPDMLLSQVGWLICAATPFFVPRLRSALSIFGSTIITYLRSGDTLKSTHFLMNVCILSLCSMPDVSVLQGVPLEGVSLGVSIFSGLIYIEATSGILYQNCNRDIETLLIEN